jgi:hypothetical protein
MNEKVKGVIVSVADKTQKMVDWFASMKPKERKPRKYKPLSKYGWFLLGWFIGFCVCASAVLVGIILIFWI